MREAVGDDPKSVYLNEPDLYYAGRALGWKQISCFDGCMASPHFPDVLSRVEVAIYRGQPNLEATETLNAIGFQHRATVLPQGGHRSTFMGIPYGPPTYGPYSIYERARSGK